MEMKNMSVASLAALTASDAPAPGGGSISAMAGAFAAALAGMVASLTVGKKKYEAVWKEMEEVIARVQPIYEGLLDDMQRDTASFDAVMAAMAMPKSSEAEKAARRESMQCALKAAAEVPMQVAERTASVLPLAKLCVGRGNGNAVTDGLVGAMLARTAVLGAIYNVRVNLLSIQDEAFTAKMRARCAELEAYAEAEEAAIRALAPEITNGGSV